MNMNPFDIRHGSMMLALSTFALQLVEPLAYKEYPTNPQKREPEQLSQCRYGHVSFS
jgi:hypothetical protein